MIYPDYGILQADRTGILPEQKYRAAYHAEYFPRICAADVK